MINAYVGPLMDRYLAELAERGTRRSISIMQSNGGFMSTKEASAVACHPHCVLSGLALAVLWGKRWKPRAYPDFSAHLLGFDMGGTSTDVSLCDGQPRETMEASIDGFPVRVPMLPDIHTVGALRGGPIARAWTKA